MRQPRSHRVGGWEHGLDASQMGLVLAVDAVCVNGEQHADAVAGPGGDLCGGDVGGQPGGQAGVAQVVGPRWEGDMAASSVRATSLARCQTR